MPESPREYQQRMTELLQRAFGANSVEKEWSSFEPGGAAYAPRLDIAVGPFATGSHRCEEEYDALDRTHHSFLEELTAAHRANTRNDDSGSINIHGANRNARCFLAIEVENKVSRKHLMGGAINAAALGRVGVVVGWTPDKLTALVRLRGYFAYLNSVNKPSFATSNLLVVSPEQFEHALRATATA